MTKCPKFWKVDTLEFETSQVKRKKPRMSAKNKKDQFYWIHKI